MAVRSNSKAVLNFAIQDSRVDLLMLEESNPNYVFSYESSKLLRRHSKPVEITIRPFLLKTGANRSRLLRSMEKSLTNIARAGAPFIVSSDAHYYYKPGGYT